MVFRSYLFCVGLDLVGGICRTLESAAFLNGFCCFSCRPFKACEEEAVVVVLLGVLFWRRRPASVPWQDKACKINTSARTKATVVFTQGDFIIISRVLLAALLSDEEGICMAVNVMR